MLVGDEGGVGAFPRRVAPFRILLFYLLRVGVICNLRQVIGIGQSDALAERGGGQPSDAVYLLAIEKFPGRAVGFCGVPIEGAVKTDDGRDLFCKRADGRVLAVSDIDKVVRCGEFTRRRVPKEPIQLLHEKYTGIGEIVGI